MEETLPDPKELRAEEIRLDSPEDITAALERHPILQKLPGPDDLMKLSDYLYGNLPGWTLIYHEHDQLETTSWATLLDKPSPQQPPEAWVFQWNAYIRTTYLPLTDAPQRSTLAFGHLAGMWQSGYRTHGFVSIVELGNHLVVNVFADTSAIEDWGGIL